MNTPLVLITTKTRAFIAVALTAWPLLQTFHSVLSRRPYPWEWLFAGLLPPLVVLIINIAFYGVLLWMGAAFALAPLRRDEKVLMVAYWADVLLVPFGALLPNYVMEIRAFRGLAMTIAFVSSLAIVRSFWESGNLDSDGRNAKP
jgi:hypothetical protein